MAAQSNSFLSLLDPSGDGDGGASVWGILEGDKKRYFEAEYVPKIRHSEPGILSMVSAGDNMIGSQFFFTLGADLTSLDGVHCVIGHVVEGADVLLEINEAICDDKYRPYRDIRITHTIILDDPFEDPSGLRAPSRSPSPSAERLRGGRIAADEDMDETAGKTETELAEMRQEREAKARATILEIIGDLPDAEVAPPENVLFICKLNSITTDDDLEIIFSRFGKIKGCEVIRDRRSGDSLQYAFIEFEEQKSCEQAYFKMDNVLIDDRRIHVDFSQSVSRIQWRGKGRGIIVKDGVKNNKLDFNNYNKPVRANDRNNDQARDRRTDFRRERPMDNRHGNRRSRSRSPNRGKDDNRNRRMSPQRRYDPRNDPRNDRPRRRSRSPYRQPPMNHRDRKPSRSRSRSRNRNDNRERHERRLASPSRDHKKRDKDRKHKSSRRDSSSSSSDHKRSHRKRSESPKRTKSKKHKKDKKRRD